MATTAPFSLLAKANQNLVRLSRTFSPRPGPVDQWTGGPVDHWLNLTDGHHHWNLPSGKSHHQPKLCQVGKKMFPWTWTTTAPSNFLFLQTRSKCSLIPGPPLMRNSRQLGKVGKNMFFHTRLNPSIFCSVKLSQVGQNLLTWTKGL